VESRRERSHPFTTADFQIEQFSRVNTAMIIERVSFLEQYNLNLLLGRV
jgi:hypothetical protein